MKLTDTLMTISEAMELSHTNRATTISTLLSASERGEMFKVSGIWVAERELVERVFGNGRFSNSKGDS